MIRFLFSSKVCSVFFTFCAISRVVFAADALIKYREGVELIKKADYAGAQKEFSEFVAENPFEPEVKKALYYITLAAAEQNLCHEAITRANITLERYPFHSDRDELKVITGECLYKVQAFARAERVLVPAEKQVKDNSLRYRVEKTLGLLYYDSRRRPKAQKHIKSALRYAEQGKIRDPDLYRLNAALGKLYAADKGQTEAAAQYLKTAIALGDERKIPEVRSLKLLLRKISFRRLEKINGLPDNSVADIRVDGDDIYVATWGAGLVRYVRSQDKIEKIALPSPQLRGLYVDFDDIYVTSFDGVYRISKKSGQTEVFSDGDGLFRLGQKAIKDDRYIYFSTLNRGLIQYDTIKKKIITLGKDSWVGSNQVYAIDADVDSIAVGTLDKGAVIYDKKSGIATCIAENETGLRSGNIKAILLDGRFVYIGAHNDGIYVYDMQLKKLKRLNIELPFPSALARRDSEIYIGTSGQGVRVLNRDDMSVEKLSAVEGLSSNEVQILRVEGDFLWIGYLENGIDVVFRPQKKD